MGERTGGAPGAGAKTILDDIETHYVAACNALSIVRNPGAGGVLHTAAGGMPDAHADEPATILLVDDETTNREVVKGVLAPVGYRLIKAANGQQALDILAQQTPDLILLDLMMPGIDGFELCRRLKTSPQWRTIPIITLTALGLVDVYARALDSGADDFMTKPFNSTVLLARVRGYLRAKRALDSLREREARYRQLVELSPDAIVVHSAGNIVFANSAAQRLLGAASAAQLIGASVMDFVHSDSRSATGKRLQQAHGARRDAPLVEETFTRLDGQQIEVELAGAPLTYQGEAAVETVIRDVTERKRVAAALQQAKEATEAANRALSDFLASTSHEVRTPLNAIIGFTRLVMRRTKDILPARQYDNLNKSLISAEHLLNLINGILDLSKIQASKMELYPEYFDLDALLHDVVDAVDPLLEKNANTLHLVIPENIGTIYADQLKVRQSLLNLLSNASKFTDAGGIWLEAERGLEAGREWVTMRVRDSGIGMTPEQLDKLFKPFSQADAATSQTYGGTGLGLVLSQRFCQLMGGDIQVESTYGEGSTFTIRLPADRGAPSPSEAATTS